jgi:hypothetical protein
MFETTNQMNCDWLMVGERSVHHSDVQYLAK